MKENTTILEGNRVIKFRAWIDDGLDEPYMAIQGTPDLETLQSFIFHYGDRPLMQFTGLQDSKGVDIYEGDVVTFYKGYVDDSWTDCEQGLPYTIIWDERRLAFVANRKNKYLTPDPNDKHSKFPWKWEIVGNIHENPELIK